MSTVHVFINANGVFIKKTMDYVEQIDPGKHFYFVELGSTDGIPSSQLLQSRTQIEALIKKGEIRQIFFHSLHYYKVAALTFGFLGCFGALSFINFHSKC
jgi:phospholipid N-methyltransferase